MRRLYSFIAISFSVLSVVAGCMKMEGESGRTEDCVTVLEVNASDAAQAVDDEGSKVNIGEPVEGRRKTFWCEGDRLSLDGNASDTLASEYAGTSNAKFVWHVAPTEGKLLYPVSYWKNATTITLPYSQDKMPGDDNLANGTLPMCGTAVEFGAVKMKNLCAVLKIQWVRKSATATPAEICYLEFRGRNDEQVSGDFTVDYTNGTLTSASTAPETRCVRAYSMKPVSADTMVCNIVIPAGTYSKGFYARIVDKAGYYMDAYTSKSKTLAAGTVAAMPCFKYNPSAKLTALTPASAGELIAIAREWNAGRYEGGIANIALASDIEFSKAQSDEWKTLGGLGSSEVPYAGTFDGKGYAIKGLASPVPFFSAVASNGNVINVVIDSTCNFSGSRAALVGVLAGKVSGCTNNATVSFCPALKTTTWLGGFVSEAVSGAVIENCANNALVHLDASKLQGCVTGSTDNPIVGMGGVLGHATGAVTVKDCSNSGKIFCDYSTDAKINQRPSWIGGIAGRIDGSGASVSNCTNTGAVFNTNWNNSSALNGPVSGGIVGVMIAADGAKSSISSCKVLGPELMQTQRGIQGGIVGQAEFTDISDCYYSKNHQSTWGNINSYCGGICAKAFSSTVSGCAVEDANLYTKTTQACSVGGICGYLDANSKALNNSALRIRIYRNGTDGLSFGGVVGSVEAQTSEISGNSFGGKYSTDSGSSFTAFTSGNVCSSASFTVNSPNTLVEGPTDLSGVVRCDGIPMEGVVVTDGYTSIKTDVNGRFHLTSLPSKVRHVSVCLPEGYGAPITNGLPKFFVKTNGEAMDDIVLELRKISNPDRFTFFVTADPQQRSSGARYDAFAYHSNTCSSNLYETIGKRAAKITDREKYGIVLGDVVHENMSLYSNYTSDIKNYCSSVPTYHVIGNHDHDPSASTQAASVTPFEKQFGPVNYSMNIGKFHFIVMDNIQMKKDSEGTYTDYDAGLTDDQIAWLKSDLAFVPTSTPLIVCAHGPMFAKHSSGNKSVTYCENFNLNASAYKAIFAKYDKVYVLAGHMHHTFNFIYAKEKTSETTLKGVECFQIARGCGALWINEYLNSDGTPRGYLQMDMDGTSVTWKYICDVLQKGSFIGKYGSDFKYSAPSYDYRDWNYSSGTPVLKSGAGNVDENYQMKLYPSQSGNMWANIFFWDAKWGTPVMTYTNTSGASVSVDMPRVALSAGPYDFSYAYYTKYYADNNSYWKSSSGESPGYSAHMFKCTMPTDCPSKTATVTVTDRFGNKYSSSVSW